MPGNKTDSYSLENDTVLVTGATGFIGRYILAALRLTGARVVAVSRRDQANAGAQGRVRWISVPEWSPDALGQALQRIDWNCVIHAASYGVAPADRSPDEMTHINVTCAAALASLAVGRKAKAYVHVGSCSEYSAVSDERRMGTGSDLETSKLYGTSKACGTLMSHAIAVNGGMSFAAARLFNIYGPGEAPHRLLPTLFARLSANREVPLSSGTQVRDFCFATDAANALVVMLGCLCHGKAQTGIYNVCTGHGVTVREFATCTAGEMHADTALLQFGSLPMRPDDFPFVVGDPSRTAAEFGWIAETPLQDGIRQSLVQLSRPDRAGDGAER